MSYDSVLGLPMTHLLPLCVVTSNIDVLNIDMYSQLLAEALYGFIQEGLCVCEESRSLAVCIYSPSIIGGAVYVSRLCTVYVWRYTCQSPPLYRSINVYTCHPQPP